MSKERERSQGTVEETAAPPFGARIYAAKALDGVTRITLLLKERKHFSFPAFPARDHAGPGGRCLLAGS